MIVALQALGETSTCSARVCARLDRLDENAIGREELCGRFCLCRGLGEIVNEVVIGVCCRSRRAWRLGLCRLPLGRRLVALLLDGWRQEETGLCSALLLFLRYFEISLVVVFAELWKSHFFLRFQVFFKQF